LARNVLEKCELLCGTSHASTVRCMLALASNLRGIAGRTEEAEALWRRALRLQEARLGAHNTETHEAMLGLAHMLVGRNELDEAEVLLRNVHFWRELELGIESPQTRNCMNHLAHVIQLKGNLAEAETLFRRALVSPSLSRANTEQFEIEAQSMTGLIEVLEAKGDVAEAETFRRNFCQTHGPDVQQPRTEAVQEPTRSHGALSPRSPGLSDPSSLTIGPCSQHQVEVPKELSLTEKDALSILLSLDGQSSNGTVNCAKHFGHNGSGYHWPASHTPELPEADDPRLLSAAMASPRIPMMTSRDRTASLSISPSKGPTTDTVLSQNVVKANATDARCWRWLSTYCICGASSKIRAAIAGSSRNSPGPDGAAGPAIKSKRHYSNARLAAT